MALAPAQIGPAGRAVIVKIGKAETVMLAEFVPEQNPFAPTTEYVEETVGLTTIKDAFDPLLHEYVEAPEAVIVVERPIHIVDGEETIVIGNEIAPVEMVILSVLIQPELLPVTE